MMQLRNRTIDFCLMPPCIQEALRDLVIDVFWCRDCHAPTREFRQLKNVSRSKAVD